MDALNSSGTESTDSPLGKTSNVISRRIVPLKMLLYEKKKKKERKKAKQSSEITNEQHNTAKQMY